MLLSDILAKLFGSASRLKIIRLFLHNPEEVFLFGEISRRAKASKSASRREIGLLKGIGLVKSGSKYVEIKTRDKKGKKIQGWKLNESFPLLNGLKNFVLDAAPIGREKLLKKLQKTGHIKLVILAGIFGEDDSSRVDLLAVGDAIKKSALDRVVRDTEAEAGKELIYAVFNTKDFLYRLGMHDKFIRDILDYPHEKIFNKLGV